MVAFVIRRLLQSVPVILLASVAIFITARLMPGDPAQLLAGPDPSPETIAAIRASLGLDQNIAVQYIRWLGAVIQGDFGRSLISGLPVSEIIGGSIGPSLLLAAAGLVLTLVFGISMGLACGLRPGSRLDRTLSFIASLWLAIPVFWIGVVLILVFAVGLGWFPVVAGSRLSTPSHVVVALVLPALSLAIVQCPIVARFLRSSIVETRELEHVRTAHAKGLPSRLITRNYVLRNSLAPVITSTGILVGNLIGGVALVEVVFSWPGVGSILVNSLGNRDYSVVQAVLLVAVAGFLISNLIADVLHAGLDPRIRNQGSR